MATESELRQEFWTELGRSPFVMLELDSQPHTSVPMTAQLHKDEPGRIWFFTNRNGAFARIGAASATFAAKDHKLFARFAGHLVEEKNADVLDKLWSNAVAAWFPAGKNSPNVLLLELVLGEASIWDARMGLLPLTKMLLGVSVQGELQGQHANTRL